jgi:hypothetical protein
MTMAKLSAMAVSHPSSSSAEVIAGSVMAHPAVASTHALLESLDRPSDSARRELDRWRADATAVLADVLGDRERARQVVDSLISNTLFVPLADEQIDELREILDANIALVHAEY